MSNTIGKWQHDRFDVSQDTLPSALQVQYLFIGRANGVFVPLIPADELPTEIVLINIQRTLGQQEVKGTIVGHSPFTGHVFTLEPTSGRGFNDRVPQSQAGYPEITYIMGRCNATYTPLIPADELPLEIRLAGVPRTLGQQEVRGMIVGHAPSTGRLFALAQPPRINTPILNHHGFPSPLNTTTQALHSSSPPQQRRGPITQRPLPPSGVEPDPTKKEYCNFWIQTGRCGFMQQGCLYKHEMPDPQKLKLIINTTQYPRWWLAKLNAQKEAEQGFHAFKSRARLVGLTKDGKAYDADGETDSDREPAQLLPPRQLPAQIPFAASSSSPSETEAKQERKSRRHAPMAYTNSEPVDHERADPDSSSSSSEPLSEREEKAPAYTNTNAKTEITRRRSSNKPLPLSTNQNAAKARHVNPVDQVEGDLISFDPITPLPAAASAVSSTSTASSSPSTATASTKQQPAEPPHRSDPFSARASPRSIPPKAPSGKRKERVFVPKGESVDDHIARARRFGGRHGRGGGRREDRAGQAKGGLGESMHAPKQSGAAVAAAKAEGKGRGGH